MIKPSEHYSDEAWFELTSRQTPPGRASQMLDHLAGGCEECAQAYKTWSLIVATAARQPECEPPAEVLASVKAAFSLARNLPMLARISVLARLVFDSFREPLPAGVRGVSESVRHLLHEAGSFVIDVRLECEPAGRVFLAGQALPKEADGRDAGGAGVIALTGDGNVVGQTIANSVGEFQMEFAESPGLTIYIAIPDERIVAIPIPDGSEAASGN